jgi:ABC-2 type transport system ATP-binding protein
VPQALSADGQLTARENLEFYAQVTNVPRRQRRARIDAAVESMGLEPILDRLAKTFSGGMLRRLEIATALLNRPAVLFLDEPTAGLDPQSRLALWDILGELNAAGQTIMLLTHYMEEADRLCNRVAIMDHGQILALDTPAALKQSVGADTIVTVKSDGDGPALASALEEHVEGVTRTRVIDGGVELHVKGAERMIPRVVSASERAGFELVDLSVAEPTLETVFINLTGKELRE